MVQQPKAKHEIKRSQLLDFGVFQVRGVKLDPRVSPASFLDVFPAPVQRGHAETHLSQES